MVKPKLVLSDDLVLLPFPGLSCNEGASGRRVKNERRPAQAQAPDCSVVRAGAEGPEAVIDN
jgi:hypothetical protein